MNNDTNNKKNILIIFPGEMELGGIERSLIGLLDAFNYDKYEIDVFLYGHHGSLFSQLNPKAHLLPEIKELAYLRESLWSKLKHKSFYSFKKRLIFEIRSRFQDYSKEDMVREIVLHKAPIIEKHYDLAIGFFKPFDFLKEKVNADKKIGWIHTDYASLQIDKEQLRQDYAGLDRIVAVSRDVAESFSTLLPDYMDKILVIENCLPKICLIESRGEIAEEDAFFNTDDIKILSVGRFAPAKNFDNIPAICSRILSQGINIKWFLIGFGGEEAKIRRQICYYGVEDSVIILGKKNNPYPYIAACDLYVQPSRFEGKAVTVREAQMLGKPVVITNFPTAGSQLEDGVDGVIVPMDNEGCSKGIADLLRNYDLMKSLHKNCLGRDYSNYSEIKKIYEILGD